MIIKNYLTKNDCYLAKNIMVPKGIMLHSVGCNVENPMNFINSWNKNGIPKCVHAFVGKESIYETLPYNYKAWHCGVGVNGSFNNGYISVEMCEPKTLLYTKNSTFTDTDKAYTKAFVNAVYKNTVYYFAYLCEKFDLNPLQKNVILSHREAHILGYASDHSDVNHLWDYLGLSMDEFRKDVFKKMAENQKITNEQSENKYDQKYKDYDIKNIIKKDYIKEKIMIINGDERPVKSIEIDGYNYAKLSDLKKYNMDINYDKIAKKVVINF